MRKKNYLEKKVARDIPDCYMNINNKIHTYIHK